jgi:hypothetical protein
VRPLTKECMYKVRLRGQFMSVIFTPAYALAEGKIEEKSNTIKS